MDDTDRPAEADRPAPVDRPHVALVGLSGSGKTTTAPVLARRRHLDSVDLDGLIERRAGAPAATIFAERGEEAFRDLEEAVLDEVLSGPPSVLATGGGIVLRPTNRRRLRRRCTVVWLRAEPDALVARIAGSPQARPLLDGDAATALRRLARERDPLYREVADLVVDVGQEPVAAIAELVDRKLPA